MERIVERWGRLDVVVHNAIYMPLVTFEATTHAEWARQIGVGLGGMFNCTRAAWPRMKAQGGGHIIGIASGSSVRGYREEIAYCAVKHGVEGFVKALSLEAREHNIALNTIGPGARIKPTRVTWAEHDRAPAELRASWTDPVRLGRAWVWLAAQPPGALQRPPLRRLAPRRDDRARGRGLRVRAGEGHGVPGRLPRAPGLVRALRGMSAATRGKPGRMTRPRAAAGASPSPPSSSSARWRSGRAPSAASRSRRSSCRRRRRWRWRSGAASPAGST